MADETERKQFYPKTAANAVNRHRERAHYDTETVHSIVNTAPVAHVSFVPDPANPVPAILPMIARIGQFPGLPDEPACAYIHGYVSSRLFRARDVHDQAWEGVPICIAATKVVNLVLSLTPFSHSYDYRSAVVHGRAVLLDPATDHDEMLFAMQLITDGIVPHRWAHTRVPPTAAEIAATRILKIRIESASAKIRDAGVKEEAGDLKDGETRSKVWTGIIPYVETLGTPVAAATNQAAGGVPLYIQEHIRTHNDMACEIAGETGAKDGLVSSVVASIFGR